MCNFALGIFHFCIYVFSVSPMPVYFVCLSVYLYVHGFVCDISFVYCLGLMGLVFWTKMIA